MANKELRERAKQNGVSLWQIASVLGVSEPTMTRKLRVELLPAEKARILQIIEELSEEKR